MQKPRRLPDAELLVMQVIWDSEPPVTSAEVQQRVPRDWKPTSVLTFLARLTEKDFLKCEKNGKLNYYTPLVSHDAYLQRESRSFIERLCGGSVKNLVASLSDAGALTKSDVEELRAFLEEQSKE